MSLFQDRFQRRKHSRNEPMDRTILIMIVVTTALILSGASWHDESP
jgi:hypothetical protein